MRYRDCCRPSKSFGDNELFGDKNDNRSGVHVGIDVDSNANTNDDDVDDNSSEISTENTFLEDSMARSLLTKINSSSTDETSSKLRRRLDGGT